MTYDELVSRLYTLLVIPRNNEDSDFLNILPAMFEYADGRIYRELDFLTTLITQPITLVALNREIALPASVLSLRQVKVCTPVGAITNNSSRVTLDRINPETLDVFWPQAGYKPSVPKKYAVVGNGGDLTSPHIIRFMPTPDRAYSCELLGMIRPAPPSPSNQQTYLTVTYPALYVAACMVFGTGYQRDYGAQADDPARAMSWETTYTTLRQGVMLEAAQLRGEGPGWTAMTPAPAAQPRAP